MVSTIDIHERIKSDFGDAAEEVIRIFDEAISKAEYLNHNRILRCILFLSDRDINKLVKNIAAATGDPRDVMLWAEYTNYGQGDDIIRIRDFNKPFAYAHKDVHH